MGDEFQSQYSENRGEAFERRVRARELRSDATPPEQVLWSMLRDRKLHGLKFRRQHPIGPYVADFCCHEARLVVELDGVHHEDRLKHDAARDRFMQERGLKVLRFSVPEFVKDPDAVLGTIAREAEESRDVDE